MPENAIDYARPKTASARTRKSARLIWCVIVGGVPCLLLACAILLHDTFGTKSRTLISWRDPKNGAKVAVTQRTSATEMTSFLHVNDRSVVIDDEAGWGSISLVRWREWLLVLNEDHVLAAYSYNSGRLYGHADWQNLPFTIYISGGAVVASRDFGGGGSESASFPYVHQTPEQQSP